MKNYLLLSCLLLGIVSCQSPKEQIYFTKKPSIHPNQNSSVPLAGVLSFETDAEYKQLTIQIKDGTHQHQLTYNSHEKAAQGFPVVGMRPDREHEINLQFHDQSGNIIDYQEKLTYKTPALPKNPSLFPKILVPTANPEKMEPGFTLFNPRRFMTRQASGSDKDFNQGFGMLTAIDAGGEVVWYYQTDSRISDFNILPNGNFSYLTQDSELIEIDRLGNVVNAWYAKNRPEGSHPDATPVEALTFHHDATLLPNGNWIILSSEYKTIENYYTSEYDKNAPRKEQQVMGDVVIEFTPEGEIVNKWHAFENMDPYRIGYETFSGYWERRGYPGVIDWSHANTIAFNEKENAFIFNFRYQSALLKLDRDLENIEWIFGEPSGWGEALSKKLLSFEGNANWFWHQHSPSFTPNGNILLFDNGNYQNRPFKDPVPISHTQSQVKEFRIDEQNQTAELVWTSQVNQDEKLVSIAMGDVDWLPETGNVLAAYGALMSQDHLKEMTWNNRGNYPQWTMIREYQHSTPAEILWEMRLRPLEPESGVSWNLFGGERFTF